MIQSSFCLSEINIKESNSTKEAWTKRNQTSTGFDLLNVKCWNAFVEMKVRSGDEFWALIILKWSLLFDFAFAFAFTLSQFFYLSKVFEACHCLHKRKLYANAALDVFGVLTVPRVFHLVLFGRITHRFKSKDTDVSYLICKCEFLECHVTYTDTTPSQCCSSCSSSSYVFCARTTPKSAHHVVVSRHVFILENNVQNSRNDDDKCRRKSMTATFSLPPPLSAWVSSAK